MLSTKQRTIMVTAGIKVSCKHRKSLCILSKPTNSPIIKAYYTQYSTILQKVIRMAKHLYYSGLRKSSGNKNKALAEKINKENGKPNLAKYTPMELNLEHRSVNKNNAMNAFNRYYLNTINPSLCF
jgi:hypothetical protein